MGKINELDSIVIDTGVVFALADRGDSWHRRCLHFLNQYQGTIVIPCMVIPESCYLLNRYLGANAELSFIKSLTRKELLVDHFQSEDLERCKQVINKYRDLNLGLVDASVVAVCERRNIFAVLTTDRRHFSIIKNKSGKSFQLLP